MPTHKPRVIPRPPKVLGQGEMPPDKVIETLLGLTDTLTSTINELVTGFNNMAEDVAVVMSRTQAVEDTVTTLAKGSLRWGPIAEDNNRIAKAVESLATTNARALGDLTKIAESNARVLEELRKRVG